MTVLKLPEFLDTTDAVVGIPSLQYVSRPFTIRQPPTAWNTSSTPRLAGRNHKVDDGRMSVECQTCGEVHLGVVNRCWKCGNEMQVDMIKRAQQELAAAEESNASPESADPNATNSPFASGPAAASVAKSSTTLLTNRSLATGFLVASFVVGGSALLASHMTGWTIIPAIIGLGCAAASLQYRRSWLVALAMLVCLVALVISSMTAYDSLVQIYQLEMQPDDGF